MIVEFAAGAGITAIVIRLLRGRGNRGGNKAELVKEERVLQNIAGGVFIREPNGSVHPIQNLIEQELSRAGMALFDLRAEHAENLLKSGVWSDQIATSLIEVAIIGRIITKSETIQEKKYVTRQHEDTVTGRHFDSFSPDHQLYRKPNMMLDTKYEHYYEPEGEYERRREREAQIVQREKVTTRLDARFYGTDGRILGASLAEAATSLLGRDPLQIIVEKVTNDLRAVCLRSLQAHATSRAEIELFGPTNRHQLPPGS